MKPMKIMMNWIIEASEKQFYEVIARSNEAILFSLQKLH